MRSSKRLVAGFVIAVAIAAALAAVLTRAGAGGTNNVQIGTGKVSALGRAARSVDALPAKVLSFPFAEHNFASAGGAGSRLLKRDGSIDLYAVPGKGRSLCLIEVDVSAETYGGACADRSVLLTGSIYMADLDEDGSKTVVGLVGDGHTYAAAGGARAPVTGNVFVLRGVQDNGLTLGSPTVAQTVDIGG